MTDRKVPKSLKKSAQNAVSEIEQPLELISALSSGSYSQLQTQTHVHANSIQKEKKPV